MKVPFAVIACYALGIAGTLAQPNPDRPELCQGAYFTEVQGVDALRAFASTYHAGLPGKPALR